MKKALLLVAALGLALSTTTAIAADFPGADADKSGLVSLPELRLLFPGVSAAAFATADADDDGELDHDEFDLLVMSTGGIGGVPAASDELQPIPEPLTSY